MRCVRERDVCVIPRAREKEKKERKNGRRIGNIANQNNQGK